MHTEYDADGRVTLSIDAEGHKTVYLYDANGNVIRMKKKGHSHLLYLMEIQNRLDDFFIQPP
jgi:YD repeat-containing protein